MAGRATLGPTVTAPRRVLIVDDRPEIRLLVRVRLRMLDDIEVVGEASNGAEALVLVSALAPEAVVLDLEMPVMRGDEAIPKMRELAPGMPIVLYTSAGQRMLDALSEAAQPDAIVRKGGSLTQLVDQLQALLDMGPHDLLRVVLGRIPLRQAMTVFDAWVGLNVRILDSLARGDELVRAQLGGATLEELQALTGVYTHLGDNLQRAAREHAEDVEPVIHLFRTTAAAARRALLALDEVRLREFYAAWNYEVPADALTALGEMRLQLIEVLPTSGAEDVGGAMGSPDGTGSSRNGGDQEPEGPSAAAVAREASAIDREAAAIDRAAAAEDRAAASIDDLTGHYLEPADSRRPDLLSESLCEYLDSGEPVVALPHLRLLAEAILVDGRERDSGWLADAAVRFRWVAAGLVDHGGHPELALSLFWAAEAYEDRQLAQRFEEALPEGLVTELLAADDPRYHPHRLLVEGPCSFTCSACGDSYDETPSVLVDDTDDVTFCPHCIGIAAVALG